MARRQSMRQMCNHIEQLLSSHLCTPEILVTEEEEGGDFLILQDQSRWVAQAEAVQIPIQVQGQYTALTADPRVTTTEWPLDVPTVKF